MTHFLPVQPQPRDTDPSPPTHCPASGSGTLGANTSCRRGWGKAWAVTHHQFIVGWRNAGGSHLWEEQRNNRLASLVGTDHLARSLHVPPPCETSCPCRHALIPSWAGAPQKATSNTERCLGHGTWGGGVDVDGEPDKMHVTITMMPKISDLGDSGSTRQHFSNSGLWNSE